MIKKDVSQARKKGLNLYSRLYLFFMLVFFALSFGQLGVGFWVYLFPLTIFFRCSIFGINLVFEKKKSKLFLFLGPFIFLTGSVLSFINDKYNPNADKEYHLLFLLGLILLVYALIGFVVNLAVYYYLKKRYDLGVCFNACKNLYQLCLEKIYTIKFPKVVIIGGILLIVLLVVLPGVLLYPKAELENMPSDIVNDTNETEIIKKEEEINCEKYEHDKDECLIAKAVKEENVNICDDMSSEHNKIACQIQMAEATNKPEVCFQIESINTRNTCYLKLALKYKDSEYCKMAMRKDHCW